MIDLSLAVLAGASLCVFVGAVIRGFTGFGFGIAATPLLGPLDQTNIVMLFLLGVVFVAFRFGRRPAALAAVLSVVLFDLFFVPPQFTMGVSDVQYLLTFAVMLAGGVVASLMAIWHALRAPPQLALGG